jgi:nucleoside 2-deoxyribosyltransferase
MNDFSKLMPDWTPKMERGWEYVQPHPTQKVYLAGPITGLSYGDARHGWRKEFADLISDQPHIKLYSPMRGKDFLSKETELDGTPNMYMDNPMATKKGIVARDRYDVKTCDVMVANFLGSDRVSIGTCMEFGWADAYQRIIVTIIDDDNLHQHAMLNEVSGYIVTTLEEAANITKVLLTPGV